MLNVQELERQWLRYKLKSYLPKILLSSTVLIVFIVVIVIFFRDNTADSDLTHEITHIETTQHNTAKIIDQKQQTLNHYVSSSPASNHEVKESTQAQNETSSQITLTPSLNFINTLKEMPKETISKPIAQPAKTREVNVVIEDHKDIPAITQPDKRKALQSHPAEHVTEDKKVNLIAKKPPSQFSINIKEEEADIQDVITRFENNKNPALSLFVAKRYYAIKNYDNAYNYALLTNDINPDIEESWLIAAKSLDKLGKKKEAIRLLNKFIDKSHSIRGTMILEQIKDGTLQ